MASWEVTYLDVTKRVIGTASSVIAGKRVKVMRMHDRFALWGAWADGQLLPIASTSLPGLLTSTERLLIGQERAAGSDWTPGEQVTAPPSL